MHFHGGRATVSREAYPDIEAFFADIVTVYRREIAALEDAGCRYIQIDDPLLTYFISDRLRDEVRQAGDDPDARLARYVKLTNDCIAQRRPDTAIGIHLCRGNSRSGWISEGGYARIAEAVFGGLEADHLLLEYDDERSGDFEPLRHVPQGRRVVLGLVTTKRGTLERREDLLRRIDDAARFVDLNDLAISPQCGFASTVEGNVITPDDQWRKLALVVDVAARVWKD
jgi:5-methyltetrahydropteroyltriglutamate--homocysteine methyltransferase